MAPKSKTMQDFRKGDKESEEYRLRRERNNVAVKKSREKSRQKTLETADRVEYLKKENEELEGKVNNLTKELKFLKKLLLESAGRRKMPDVSGIIDTTHCGQKVPNDRVVKSGDHAYFSKSSGSM